MEGTSNPADVTGAPPTRRRLITIAISHYCEKARWALDRAGVAYVEEKHLPNFHYLASFRVARTPYVPILVEGDAVVPDSTAILHHVDALRPAGTRLFPDDPTAGDVRALEDRFDRELGPATRLWGYFGWFDRPQAVLRYALEGTPAFERRLAPLLLGLVRYLTSKRFDVTPERADAAIRAVRTLFDEMGTRLADGRPFLAGDRFSAADLTFAALAAPVLLPPGHGVPLPPVSEAPAQMRTEIERLRATPAGAFALRLYAEERRPA